MSRTSRARKLSVHANISYQHVVQHLGRLDLGPRDEKEYVNSLAGGGVVHRQTCICALQFFTVTPSAALCPGCAKAAPSVRVAEAAQQMNPGFQEMMDAANPARRLLDVKMAEKAHSARSLHEMGSASDPARRLLEMEVEEKAHSARSLQEMMDAADPRKPK
jgi:hypothetical protein